MDDIEIKNNVECGDDYYKPYPVPCFSEIMINKNGDLFNIDGKKRKLHHYDDGKHYNYICVHDASGKCHHIGIHRLVAMTFDPNWFDGCAVHHKDENKYNNALWNLEVTDPKEHGKHHNKPKYSDVEAVCEVCGKTFMLTSTRQSNYFRDIRRGRHRIITCSRKCWPYAGRMKQLGRDI